MNAFLVRATCTVGLYKHRPTRLHRIQEYLGTCNKGDICLVINRIQHVRRSGSARGTKRIMYHVLTPTNLLCYVYAHKFRKLVRR